MEIYVGNLPYSATREDVAALFRPYGDVRDVRVVTDRETRRSKGFGFVTMPDAEARRAIEALNGNPPRRPPPAHQRRRPRRPPQPRPTPLRRRSSADIVAALRPRGRAAACRP